MKEKPPIDFNGKTNLTAAEIQLLQLLKPATQHLEEILEQNEQNPQGVSPKGVRIGWDDNSVSLVMNNCDKSIKVRKTNNGFEVSTEVNEEEIRQTLDDLFKVIIIKK